LCEGGQFVAESIQEQIAAIVSPRMTASRAFTPKLAFVFKGPATYSNGLFHFVCLSV
jgi:hypothetical protein